MIKKKEWEAFEKAARVLKAIAHPVRIEIVNLLIKEKSLSVSELQSRLNISQSMTSQHLASLKNVGVLKCNKNANVCKYYIFNKNVLKLMACVGHCTSDNNV